MIVVSLGISQTGLWRALGRSSMIFLHDWLHHMVVVFYMLVYGLVPSLLSLVTYRENYVGFVTSWVQVECFHTLFTPIRKLCGDS